MTVIIIICILFFCLSCQNGIVHGHKDQICIQLRADFIQYCSRFCLIILGHCICLIIQSVVRSCKCSHAQTEHDGQNRKNGNNLFHTLTTSLRKESEDDSRNGKDDA